MTFSASQLLNIITLKQLLQLESKIPNFLENQLILLKERWPHYMSELAEAIKTNDASGAADLCHKLKGHGGMLGFQAVLDQAEELEMLFRNAASCHENIEVPQQLQRLFSASIKAAEDWLIQNSLKS